MPDPRELNALKWYKDYQGKTVDQKVQSLAPKSYKMATPMITDPSNYTSTFDTAKRNVGSFTLNALDLIGKGFSAITRGVRTGIVGAGGWLANTVAVPFVPKSERDALGGTWGTYKALNQETYNKQNMKNWLTKDTTQIVRENTPYLKWTNTQDKANYKQGGAWAEFGINMLTDPTNWIGLNSVTKPAAGAKEAVGIVGRGGQVTGSVFDSIGSWLGGNASGGIRALRQGESLTMPSIKASTGTIAKLANKYAPQIQRLYQWYQGTLGKVLGKEDVVAAALGASRTQALKEAGIYNQAVDFFQRGAIEKGQNLDANAVKRYVYDFMNDKVGGLNRLTPEEFAQRTSDFFTISTRVDDISNGLAIRRITGSKKAASSAFDWDAAKQAVSKKGGKYEFFGGGQKITIGKSQYDDLVKQATAAKKAGYEIVAQPGKAAVLSPVTFKKVNEGFTKVKPLETEVTQTIRTKAPVNQDDEFLKGLITKGNNRNFNQQALEAAARKGDNEEIKALLNSIPKNDPYRASMFDTFKQNLDDLKKGIKFSAPQKLGGALVDVPFFHGESATAGLPHGSFLGKGTYGDFTKDLPAKYAKGGQLKEMFARVNPYEVLHINTMDDYNAFVKAALRRYGGEAEEAMTKYAKDYGIKMIIGKGDLPDLVGTVVTDAKRLIAKTGDEGYIVKNVVKKVPTQFEAPLQELKPSALGKFFTGSKITDADIYNQVQRNIVDKVTRAAGGDANKMRSALSRVDDWIRTSQEKAVAAKDMPFLKQITLGEGLTGAARYMDVPNKVLNDIGKQMGVKDLAYALKSSYMTDWSTMGIQNIGTWLRSKSSVVDWLSRTKQALKFEFSPMFHAQQHVENFVVGKIAGQSNDDVIDFFDDSFRSYANSLKSKSAKPVFGSLGLSIEDPHFLAKSYDVSLVAKTGKKFMIDDINRLTQGTAYGNWEGLRSQLVSFLGKHKQEALDLAKERGLSLTQAILDINPKLQPAIAILNEAAYNGERVVRGMVQMSFIRGGLERSANYIWFPTSYVVRMTKTLAHFASQPGGLAAVRTINFAKQQAQAYVSKQFGVDKQVMPNTMWVIDQLIPLGLTDLGGSMDPLLRWTLATFGLSDYIKKPSDLKKSYIPVYRNYKDLEAAATEIKKAFAAKEVQAKSTTGFKVLVPKEIYKTIIQPIPYNITAQPEKTAKGEPVQKVDYEKLKKAKKGRFEYTPTPRAFVKNPDVVRTSQKILRLK